MTVDVDALNGTFKKRYGDALEKVLPEFGIIADDIKFERRARPGASYNIPVRLRRSMGWTWNADGSAFALNSPVSGLSKEATLTPSEFVLREQFSYAVAFRAQDSEQAFGDNIDESVEDMTESAAFAREIALLYGGSNIGEVESQTGATTARDWVISKASWAAGLWSQAEGMNLDVLDASGAVVNTNAAVVLGTVDDDTRTLSVTGNATDLSAIDTEIAGTGAFLIPYGAKDKWFSGLDVIVPNTGTLFGIAGATYSAWTGNSKSMGSGSVSLGKVLGAAAKSTVRGGMGKLVAYLSTYTWQDLNTDHAALRRLGDEAKMETVLGTKKITYIGPNGTLEIKSHPMVKAGEGFIIPPEKFERRGSTDLTFRLPDLGDDKFFRQLTDNAGFELRCYWDQALFARNLSRCVKLTNIVNTSL